ncbi:MAG: aminopeptidase N [Acidimicrobiia bacterium]
MSARDRLARQEAEERAARISSITYDLSLDLVAGDKTYRGEVAIEFSAEGGGDSFLEFTGGAIERFEVNGARMEPECRDHRVILRGAWLEADNLVRMVYENRYDHGGEGFHQFIDPQDGGEYLFTQFEPYQAHRLFPCFDQPDLKAVYRLTVDAPDEWRVVSNAAELEGEDLADGRRRHHFEPSLAFSTYLFAVLAGPYQVVRDQHGAVPLGLYCRESMLPHLEAEELFELTRQGLDYYGEFFARPYPFTKYDQVFVPEFNWGGMENAGAVAYTDLYLFRDRPTATDRLRRAEVFLHELAHMWFGDLVTMRWWDDLWLNESFASYLAYLAVAEATRFDGSWQNFHHRMKLWAYRQDELVTTHQIADEVPSTDEVFLNFDGITYGKGAAVIKQLVASIGLEGFRKGMRRYFERYAFGTATLADFLAALEEGSGLDLADWAAAWLRTRSLNGLACQWEADDGRITRLGLRQSAPAEHPHLRPHVAEVALVAEREGRLEVRALPARIEGEEAEVREAAGLSRPWMVVPNQGDHAYAKISLDARSLEAARSGLGRIDDPLLRQLVWSSLWTMVRDRRLRSTDFLDLMRRHLPDERDLQLLEMVIGLGVGSFASGAIAPVILTSYVPETEREEEAHRFVRAAWEAVQSVPDPDAQALWMRGLVTRAGHPDDLRLAGRLVDGEESIPGLEIDREMRWEVAVRWMAHGLGGAEERLAGERERNPTDRGQRAALRAEASRPDREVKEEVWERLHGHGYPSLHLARSAMGGFAWPHQARLLEPYVDRFFRGLPEVFQTWEPEAAKQYFLRLFPHYRVEAGTVERSRAVLAEAEDPMLHRLLREAIDDLERAIACRAYAEQSVRT